MTYYDKIKTEFINNEVYKKVKDYSKNKNDLLTYYNVGKLLVEAQGGEKRAKYGDSLIKEYSKRLTLELGKGYTVSSLKRIRQFYYITQKGATVSHQLTWSHYYELLKFDDVGKINYYIKITEDYNLSVRELREKIKNNEYERLDTKTKEKLITSSENKIEDFIKNPIIIKNSLGIEEISEKVLMRLILEDLDDFLKELGEGFSYIESEYKIKVGNSYNYIDILLFNIIYNCYVVVELKITELKKEHIGQINMYMNYIDKKVKDISHNSTIGIIICRKDNYFVIEYASNPNIFRTVYRIKE